MRKDNFCEISSASGISKFIAQIGPNLAPNALLQGKKIVNIPISEIIKNRLRINIHADAKQTKVNTQVIRSESPDQLPPRKSDVIM